MLFKPQVLGLTFITPDPEPIASAGISTKE